MPRTSVRIKNTRTGHRISLARDHIYNFTSNPEKSRAGEQDGFLTLHVQLFMRGREVWVRPNAQPGETVEPQSVEVVEQWVDLEYPGRSSLKTKLEADGYRLSWAWDTRIARLVDVEGWEIVIEPDAQGVLTKFRTEAGPNQTLIKRREGSS